VTTRLRFVPPAGTQLTGHELWRLARNIGANRNDSDDLADAIRARFDVPHASPLSSGRAALALLLRTLADSADGRDEVVVPGYTCYSVAASAVRGGLKVRPIDIDPDTLDYSRNALDALDTTRTLAIVGTSLYGIPSDLPHLERFARDRRVFLVDDAAQCLGGQVGGRWAGTFGDAGILSFDKGKNITSLQGGVLLVREPGLADRIATATAELPTPSRATATAFAIKILLYALLLRPRLYWIPNALLTLGETPFELDYPIRGYPGMLASLVRSQLDRLDDITRVRTRNAADIRARLSGVSGLSFPDNPAATSVHPRLPVLLESASHRDAAIARLHAGGIGATGSYPRALVDVPPLQPSLAPDTADTPVARSVAERIITLPTHAYVTESDREVMARILGAPGRRG